MGKKGVEDMINEIQIYLDNCKRQPLAPNKIVVLKEELEERINELRLKLPSEFERSKKIMRNKEAILASARTRSDAIISESVNEANRLVETNHITELANARANEILEAARAEAQQILDDATAEAQEIRLASMDYTQQKLTEMKNMFKAFLAADSEHYRNLCDSLENQINTIDDNITDMDTSINLLQGKEPSMPVYRESAQSNDNYDEYDDESEDYDDDESEDYDDDDFDDDDFDDDDDFLDE